MNWRHGAMVRGLAPRMVYRGLFLLVLCCAAVPVPALTVDEAEALYLRGEYAAALAGFRAAAAQQSVMAQFYLGVMYAHGLGVPKDEGEAARWYRLAAEQGHAGAQYNLGVMHANGQGVPRDDSEAVRWYILAAEQGNPRAQFNLGLMYVNGRGVPKAVSEALRWFRLAAEQGHGSAQTRLGAMYLQGRGVPKDESEAVRWFRSAAEQGNADGQFTLGLSYENGLGVSKNEGEAVRWYRLAAEQGLAIAQSNLGAMYAFGKGVPQDYRTAYFWYLLSSALGHEIATRNRDLIEGKLTNAERAEAQTAARDWKPKSTGTAAAPSAPSESPPSSAAEAAPAVTGTGFRVARNRFVTNDHVVRDCRRVQVDGIAAQVGASDSRSDLALLSATIDGATVKMRAQRPVIGETVTVAGFPLQGLLSGFQLSTGTLSSLSGPGGDTSKFQITAPVQAGSSGGPVLDGSGRLLGVVVSKLNALKTAKLTGDIPQNVNFAISANAVRSFLDANGVDYETSSSADRPLPTPTVARQAQSYTVLVSCWQ